MRDYIGARVQCTRDGLIGDVIEQDSLTMSIDASGKKKYITVNTFNRWWKVIAEPDVVEDEKQKEKERKPLDDSKIDGWGRPAGEYGIGPQLRDKFMSIVRDYDDQDNILIIYNDEKKQDIVRYKGVIILECTYADRRFNVLTRVESLTPMNRNKADKIIPKSWSWTLRAKFVFIEMSQWPLMKSIITDAFFHANHRDKEENY